MATLITCLEGYLIALIIHDGLDKTPVYLHDSCCPTKGYLKKNTEIPARLTLICIENFPFFAKLLWQFIFFLTILTNPNSQDRIIEV